MSPLRHSGGWQRWPATIAYIVAVCAIVWAIWQTNVTSHHADQLSRDVATLTAQQSIEACRADNATREHVSQALTRIIDDVDLVSDDPTTEKVLTDLRSYVRDKLGQVPCAVPATIEGDG